MESKNILGAPMKAKGLVVTVKITDTDYYKCMADMWLLIMEDSRINKEVREEYKTDLLDKFNEIGEKYGKQS